jgi:hypothetical protein
MNTTEKMRLIGTKVLVKAGNFDIEVFIIDFKTSYGRDRWLVKPVAGTGENWIEKYEEIPL